MAGSAGGGTACGPKPHPDPPAAPPLLCAGPGFPSSSHPPSGSVESRLTCLSPPWRCCVPSTRGWAQSSTPTDAEPPRQHVSPELGGATALPNTSAHDGPQVCVCVCVCVRHCELSPAGVCVCVCVCDTVSCLLGGWSGCVCDWWLSASRCEFTFSTRRPVRRAWPLEADGASGSVCLGHLRSPGPFL